MAVQPGQIICSSSLLDGSFFEKAVILVTEKNEKGCMGFVLNQPFHRPFNELAAFSHCPPLPLLTGGPVQTDMLYCLHRLGNAVPNSNPVSATFSAEGDFSFILDLLLKGHCAAADITLFLGYCGWDAGELEAEIAEGSWITTTATPEIAFNIHAKEMWYELHANYTD
jgi:putative transcriptional regulator